MTSLRRRMTEDMQVRNLSLQTKPHTCSRSRCLHAISISHPRYWDLRRFALTRFISRTKGSSLQALLSSL